MKDNKFFKKNMYQFLKIKDFWLIQGKVWSKPNHQLMHFYRTKFLDILYYFWPNVHGN